MVETKEYYENARQKLFNMVNRYNREIDEMEKTGMLEGRKVTKGDIQASKDMRTQRLNRINEITADLKKYYGN